MKIIVASDLHGDAVRCEELLDRFRAERTERLILLGDILYHGPRNDLPPGYNPKKVIALLNPLADAITCVRGNCDAEVDGMVLDFDVLTPEKFIKINGVKLLLTHGHHLDKLQPEGADAVLFGHTHIPCKEQRGGVWFINPGSTSIPKENSAYAYMTFYENTFEWKQLDTGAAYDRLSL